MSEIDTCCVIERDPHVKLRLQYSQFPPLEALSDTRIPLCFSIRSWPHMAVTTKSFPITHLSQQEAPRRTHRVITHVQLALFPPLSSIIAKLPNELPLQQITVLR
jgi:hypothetical protein